jgi:hypothetical protein
MNVSNEHLLLINILNSMYNDNNRQIQNLSDQNNQIINIITDILHVPSTFNNQNNRYTANNRQTTSNRQSTNNRQQSSRQNNNNQNNLGSIFLNNRQYIIDDIQRFNLPLNPSVIGTGLEGRLTGNYIDAAARNVARNVSRNVTRDGSGNISRPQTESTFTNLFQSFFDPVLVYPTISQIETATRRVLYRDILAPINSSCPISMDNFNDNDTVTIIRHCGHIFNSDELNTWFQSNCRCPVCRYDIRNFNRNTSSINNQERNNNGDLIHDSRSNSLPTRYNLDASGNSVQW